MAVVVLGAVALVGVGCGDDGATATATTPAPSGGGDDSGGDGGGGDGGGGDAVAPDDACGLLEDADFEAAGITRTETEPEDVTGNFTVTTVEGPACSFDVELPDGTIANIVVVVGESPDAAELFADAADDPPFVDEVRPIDVGDEAVLLVVEDEDQDVLVRVGDVLLTLLGASGEEDLEAPLTTLADAAVSRL